MSLLLLYAAGLAVYLALEGLFLARLARAPERLGLRGSEARSWRRYALRRALGVAAGAAFWVAASLGSGGALRTTRYVSEPVTGTELAFVIDVSNSMLSSHGDSTRLEIAKDFSRRLAASVEGAALSVIAFRGSPATICPPTRDRAAFEEALDWAGPWAASAAGSNLGAALEEALRPTLAPGGARVVVVLSDGNDTGGKAAAAARRAGAEGNAVILVGVGGPERSPVFDPEGRAVPSRSGAQAATALDGSAMRAWADAARGLYLDASSPEALARAVERCASVRGVNGNRDVRIETDASPFLALVALVAAALSGWFSSPPLARRSPKAPRRESGGAARRAARLAPLALVLIAPTASSCGLARDLSIARANRLYRDGYAHEASALYLRAGAEGDAVVAYDLANVFASLGEAEAAEALYESAIALGDAGIAARSWYNRGAAAYGSGDFGAATLAFRRAIEAYGGASPSGSREAALRRELSRAYELASRAERETKDAGAVERGSFSQGRADGPSSPLTLSRIAAKSLFLPGAYEPSLAEDH